MKKVQNSTIQGANLWLRVSAKKEKPGWVARPLRIEYPGAVYHVMNRGLARQPVFRDPTDYDNFLQVLRDTYTLWGVEVFAYCLMGNHYHLCLRTPTAN